MSDLDHRQVIAIDGPAAAGKSTVAKVLADRVGGILFDTGALYRTVTLLAQRAGVADSDETALAALVEHHQIDIRPSSVDDGRQVDVLLDGEDVTWEIRTPYIDSHVSEVSAHPAVRQALLGVQREIADGARIVMVGRDIGTVVIPAAGLKVFLEASAAERARRRHTELQGRGTSISFQEVLADLEARDAFDANRQTAPLAVAADAVLVPTDGRTIDEVVDEIELLAAKRWAQSGVAHE